MHGTKKLLHSGINYIIANPIKTIFVSLFICSLLAIGLRYFELNPSPRDYLGKDTPLVKHLIELEEEYIEDLNILLMIKPNEGTVFNQEVLAAVKKITDASWEIPFSRRVDSITNYQHTHADGDELIVEDLVSDPSQLSQSDLEKIKHIALNEPSLVNRFVSADAEATAVNILFNLDLGNAAHTESVHQTLNKIKQDIIEEYPNLTTYETGFVSLTYHWNLGALLDIRDVFLVSLIIIVVGLIYFFGSVSATLAVVFTSMLSVVTALGVVGLSGGSLTPASALGTLMILVLGLADGIHITKSVRRLLKEGYEYNKAIVEAVNSNLMPIALTSVTTAIGFLTFNLTGYAGIEVMGSFVAFGVMAAFALSITLLPALLRFCHLKPEPQRTATPASTLLANFVINHKTLLLLLTAPTVLLSMYFISLNEIDERITRYLKDDYIFTADLIKVQEDLTGTNSMIYNFNSSKPGGVSDPEFMAKVESFVQWASQQPNVRHVSSYTDTMKRLNKNMHADDSAYYTLPDDRNLAAQYLLLYEMSLPYGLDLTHQINLDKSGTRVVLTTNDVSMLETKKMVAKNKAWLINHIPEFNPSANSDILATLLMAEDTIEIIVASAIGALIIIGLILLFTFRSFYAGLLCVIAVVSPILVTYGIWGLTVGTVNVPAALAMCMIIGISVDFSVHLISKFVYAQRQLDYDIEQSVRYAFALVSAPIVTSVIVLGGGFFVLILSVFSYNSIMGQLTAMCILFAALATFLLVPSILLTSKISVK